MRNKMNKGSLYFLSWLATIMIFVLPAVSGLAQTTDETAAAHVQTSFKFAFGSELKRGWIQVTPANLYSDKTGYGFEPGADVSAPPGGNYIESDKPFYFSVKEPEGNYRVTARFGDGTNESVLTVKAELRRLMLEKIPVPPGKTATRDFVVNIRTPFISSSNHVHLKSREKTSEIWDWDDKMTLEFNGEHPCLRSLEITKVNVPTVFVIGDSTVCDQPAAPWNSWGQMLTRFFKPDVAVANHSESGETVADSLGRQRFAKIFSLMKPGDYLFVQFGHNDMKNRAPNAREIYQSDLKKVIEQTRALGSTPVLVTSMEREAGVNGPTLEGYPQAVRDVAKEEHCALIDLNKMSLVFYRALGANLDKAFVSGQSTHHDNYGSYELAQCVLDGIQQDKLPLAKDIVRSFKGFDPAHPDSLADFHMAASPISSNEKPLGN
jgi:lysophospholipase L1-like esterase